LFKLTGGNVKAVCAWIGNTPQVALNHYAQVTDADLKEAAKMALINDAEKGIHNHIHNNVDSSSTEPQEPIEHIDVTTCDCDNNQEFAGACNVV
jgi:hypothetical protein